MFNLTTSDTATHYEYNYKIRCEKCDGTGFQQRNDGVYVICPICDGTGWRDAKKEREPCYPQYPWYPMSWRDGPTYTEPQYPKCVVTYC